MRVMVIVKATRESESGALPSREILAEMGHGVCAIVATEAEAITAALQHRPDLIIADVRLRPLLAAAVVVNLTTWPDR